jgi:hypothetical protein
VRFLEEREGLVVEPRDQSPTLAVLDGACPEGARHIRAQVMTLDPDAVAVEYSLAVRNAVRGEEARTTPPATAAASSWLRLLPGTPSEVHLFLETPLSARADLVLATRFPHGVRTHGCRAVFWDIRALAGAPGDAR